MLKTIWLPIKIDPFIRAFNTEAIDEIEHVTSKSCRIWMRSGRGVLINAHHSDVVEMIANQTA